MRSNPVYLLEPFLLYVIHINVIRVGHCADSVAGHNSKVRPGKPNVGTRAHVGQLCSAWHTGSRLLLPLAVLDGGTDNNDNPSELQLEANRPPIIFLYISFRLRPFSQIICVEFSFVNQISLVSISYYICIDFYSCVPNKWGDPKNGQGGVELSYLFYSGQGAVFFFFFLLST